MQEKKRDIFNQYKVSVITPVFNDEKYVVKTISSIANQTYHNLEIIIVDDCSNDKTVELVKNIHDPRIIIIRNDVNRGAAFSRNAALKTATGDYIAFLDGDDLWERDKVEKQLDFMLSNNIDFSCTSYKLIDENDIDLNKTITAPRIITHKKLLKSNYIGCLTVMYKRNIFPDLEIPTNILKRNDYALWLKLSEKADCYFLNEPLAKYRKRSDKSLSSSPKKQVFKSHIILFRSLYGFSKVKSFFYALRNVFYYFVRKNKYNS